MPLRERLISPGHAEKSQSFPDILVEETLLKMPEETDSRKILVTGTAAFSHYIKQALNLIIILNITVHLQEATDIQKNSILTA